MDQEFLTIKQAAERYVVSDMTLRRLARDITRDEKHELREYVRPGSLELGELKRDNKPFEYELSTKLVGLRYKQREPRSEEGSGEVGDTRADVGSAAMIILESTNDLLRDQLKVKDEQIRQLNESLRAMQQQQNATNVLLVRLSERIPLLSEGGSAKAEATEERTVDVQTVEAGVGKKKPKASVNKTGKPKTKPKKPQSRGVLSRWFRSARADAAATK